MQPISQLTTLFPNYQFFVDIYIDVACYSHHFNLNLIIYFFCQFPFKPLNKFSSYLIISIRIIDQLHHISQFSVQGIPTMLIL